MKIIDITRTLQDAPVYQNDPGVKVETLSSTENGDGFNVSLITATSHSGTHADSTSHYLGTSGKTIDEMPLDLYCGNCAVISVPQNTIIKASDLQGKIEGAKKIVLHGGGNSFLSVQAAQYLISCGVRTIVTDAVSVAPSDNEGQIHEILLGADAAIIENVILDGVTDGRYILFAFPAKYGGLDGAPVRAVLIAQED